MIHRIAVTLLLFAVARELPGQSLVADRWDAQVRMSFTRADAMAGSRGYSPVGIQLVGTLFVDESEIRDIPLPMGGAYLVIGVCDQDCRTLNLVLADPKGDEIASDRGEGNAPMVEARSGSGGHHRLRVIMGGCQVSPCRYGVVVYRKGGKS